MSSEIFDEYIRIATEKGLISTAETDPLKETNPRYDSQDISTIEALYGVRPNDEPKGYRNIIETAHPEPVHIAPSHDKMNGLVENGNELQDILVNIVARPPSGSIAYRKLAEQNFVMELIRVANHLDNVGEEDLRILADSCIETFEKKK